MSPTKIVSWDAKRYIGNIQWVQQKLKDNDNFE
jgi:hypothetical protein